MPHRAKWCQRRPAVAELPAASAASHGFRLDPPSDEQLARALDELVMAYHDAPEGFPADDDREPPREDVRVRLARLGRRFPEYGFYALADPTEPLNEEGLVGDAIDDLADIAGDLEEVVWRHENLGPDDAHWHFKLGFRSHWGTHLRDLSGYLHARIW